MENRILGRSGIKVSSLCLGTMTWGQQNTEAEAHIQLDAALDSGINFIDCAEMYPVPPRAETQGLTERYLGSWLKKTGRRHDVVIASKVCGRSDNFPWIRDGGLRLDRRNIEQAIDASLQRLGIETIDLYQMHWPDRPANFFGQLGYVHQDQRAVSLEETLEVFDDLMSAGKIRCIGMSNETPWGVMHGIQVSREKAYPRLVSIQNPYNLLNRTYEIGLAEVSQREDAGLLAYSPLAFGVLSGKYLDGAKPEGARLSLFDRFTRYSNEEGQRAARAYVELARGAGIDPAQMALSYVTSRSFVVSTIIGATRMDQLKSNIQSAQLDLSADILREIENIHHAIPNPCP